MRLPLKTVKPEEFFLLTIHVAKYVDANALIVLQVTVFDAEGESACGNIGRLCRVGVIALSFHDPTSLD
jgi:hypothetical protein